MHTEKGFGGACVDALQSAMRHRAAQERDMKRAWDVEVVDETALAAQQRPVLDAHHAAAEQRCWCRRHRGAAAETMTPCAMPRRRPVSRRGSQPRASWRTR